MCDFDGIFDIGPEDVALAGTMTEKLAEEKCQKQRLRRELEDESKAEDDCTPDDETVADPYP